MQGGIGEHRVKLRAEIQLVSIQARCFQPARQRRLHHGLAGIDAQHLAAASSQPFGKRAIAAAEIKNPFTRLWGQQPQGAFAKRRHEGGVRPVLAGVPVLAGSRHQRYQSLAG